jgi:hypothetical protein
LCVPTAFFKISGDLRRLTPGIWRKVVGSRKVSLPEAPGRTFELTRDYTLCIKARVTSSDYRQALETAIREYEGLVHERQVIDKRLAQLAQTISTLNRLCGFTANVFWGMTDACRVVLRNAGHPMTPTEVRDRLEAIGLDLSKYTNSLSAIHTVIKRLVEAQEVRLIELDSRRFAYEWQRPPKSLALNEEALARFERRSNSSSSSSSRRKKR